MNHQKQQRELRVKVIRAIAKELREDRNRPSDYAMKAARRYTSIYFLQVRSQYA